MADLALSKTLINEYINYKFNQSYDPNKIRKLFKYIQSFAIRTTHSDFFSDPATAGQFTDPLVEIIDDCTDNDLVQNSRLKFMLIDTIITVPFITTNINPIHHERLEPKFCATYTNSQFKNNALKHIKALLSDANWVKITDRYINTNNEWSINKTLISNLVPHNVLNLNIVSGSQTNSRGRLIVHESKISVSQQQELKNICTNWNVTAEQLNTDSIHDRYIETNKVKILLSSGLYHLDVSSNKDFTYIIELKPL